jgi:hypothetical protein
VKRAGRNIDGQIAKTRKREYFESLGLSTAGTRALPQAVCGKSASMVSTGIGFAPGTGGSSGVGFLKKALDLTFFPELWEVRTLIASPGKF